MIGIVPWQPNIEEMTVKGVSWTDFVTVTVAALALIISALSFFVSWRAYRLSVTQDRRRLPELIPSLRDGYVRYLSDNASCIYGFLLSVSNPTDANNAVATVELHITYSRTRDEKTTVKIPSEQSLDVKFARETAHLLPIPARVDAHQTLTGWCFFSLKKETLGAATIEGYKIALIDSHGIEAHIEPIMVQEYVEEG
jgi:hypothetical protein